MQTSTDASATDTTPAAPAASTGRPGSTADRAATLARAAATRASLDADIAAGLSKIREAKEAKEAKDRGEHASSAKGGGDAKPEPKAKPAASAEEDTAETEDGAEGEEEAEAEAKPADEIPLDESAKKKLEAEQHRDRKHREQLAREKSELEAGQKKLEAAQKKLEAEWAPRVAAAEKFEALKGKGIRGLVEAAEHFGLQGDDLELAAQHLYALSPAGAKNPKSRASAEAAVRDREIDARLTAAEKRAAAAEERAAAAEKKFEERETQARTQANVNAYLDSVEKAAKAAPSEGQADASPLLRSYLEKAPARARALLQQVTFDLLEDGAEEAPSAAAVVAAAEKRRRADLSQEGIDPDLLLGGGASTASTASTVDKRRPSRTLGNGGGAGGTAPGNRTLRGKELDRDIVEGLRKLRGSGSV